MYFVVFNKIKKKIVLVLAQTVFHISLNIKTVLTIPTYYACEIFACPFCYQFSHCGLLIAGSLKLSAGVAES